MSKTSITQKNKYLIWAISAGRCQYRGCAKKLYEESLTKRNFNTSYIAHIVADSPEGPRGDHSRSESLKNDLRNLMLLCDEHHRLIDIEDVEGHPEKLLLEMKNEHEERVNNIFINPSKSHIVTYKANIGTHFPSFEYHQLYEAIKSDYYPADSEPIDIGNSNSLNEDSDDFFWQEEKQALDRKFDRLLLPGILDGTIRHISLFAFAPIPLLIYLGTLINDIVSVDIRQKRRNPDTWIFEKNGVDTSYKIIEPSLKYKTVAVKLELSDSISDNRVKKVLGDDVSIYSIQIENPDNDFVKSRKQIIDFGETIKNVFKLIKKNHCDTRVINIFPALPIALAVQLGRVWMPKADLSLRIYDQNKKSGGFSEAIYIE